MSEKIIELFFLCVCLGSYRKIVAREREIERERERERDGEREKEEGER